VLGDAKVNILAFHGGAIVQNSLVHVVVDKANTWKKTLSAAELNNAEADVLPTGAAECRRGSGLLHLVERRWVPSPDAFPVSAVCCNEHSRGFGFAMPLPEYARRMGSALTTRSCIPDMH
jgi:hypothetical protein